jgi:DNA-binding SARP family transcriptional activator
MTTSHAPVDATSTEFLILGPLEVRRDGRTLRLGSVKHRMLLAKLLLRANQVVSTDELIDAIWGDDPPATVRQSLQNHIAALRKAIELASPAMLVTREPGYLLRVTDAQVDLRRFKALAEEGRAALAAGDAAGATRLLGRALALWRGPALADLTMAVELAWPELVGLDELRLAALEARIEADLALGRHQQLVGELKTLVGQHALREHLHGQLMLALYRSSRQADALAAYQLARQTLVEELGIEPSSGLQRLEQAILVQDPALELLAPARPGQARGEPAVPARPDANGAGAERKLVTVLFVDVEPPAEDGERDPEDVWATQAAHLETITAQVEAYGGTVAHAVGGATMAVFGVPRTREDDPERAVRAALAIRESLRAERAGPVPLRAAVTTGEALVGFGRGRITGDLVTTCVRLHQAAPPGTILVSEATERATERTICYGPESLLSLEGRAQPVAVWSALEPRNHTGFDLAAGVDAPLVGCDAELARLHAAFERARSGRGPTVVTLVGEAGIGKTRLVAELGRAIHADADLVSWRVGRCLPYGEATPFRALAEIVRAEAGIVGSDPAERAERKLSRAVRHAVPDDLGAADWVEGHLRRLLGLGDEPPLAAGRQDEAPTAWRRFLLGLAAQRPLVLVVEDLHWADDELVDFLEGLAGPPADRTGARVELPPLLVLATARPALLDRRAGRTPSTRPAADALVTIPLGPLSQRDTTELLELLLAGYVEPVAVAPALVAWTGGNPLFAEEYARLVRDHGAEPAHLPELPLPATVHAIISARLDTLPAEDKTVLQDAAVLGRTGWAGALAAMGGRDRSWLEGCLDRLERRDFVRRLARPSVAGEREFEFRHVLVRDVAYGQIPRAERAGRHRRAAEWLEGPGARRPGRAADRAELLAHHYHQALTMARAAGRDEPGLADKARLAMREAGDRAAALGAHTTAARHYGLALDLWPADAPDRPDLELRTGRSSSLGEGRGEELLTRARDGLLVAGDREQAAEAEMLLAQLAYMRGQRERAAALNRALALVADQPPSRSKAAVLRACMLHLMVSDRHAEAIDVARQTLAMAEDLGLREIEASVLETTGAVRVSRGDPDGIQDLHRGAAVYRELGSPHASPVHINLAYAFSILGDLPRCFEARAEAWRIAERFGSTGWMQWTELERVAEYYWTGRWDDALRILDAFLARDGDEPRHYLEGASRIRRGRIRLAQAALQAGLDDAGAALERARESGDRQNLDPALVFGARALLDAGRPDAAAELVDELVPALSGGPLEPDLGVDLGVVLVATGRDASALDGVPVPSRWLDAARAFVAGDASRAADLYAAIGSRPDEAYARLVAARQLVQAGRTDQLRRELDAAVAFYEEVGATAHLEEAGRLQLALV